MSGDKRYQTVKKLLTAGLLHSFREIFDIVPKSVMAADLGMNNTRFSKHIYRVQDFTLSDTFRMAKILDVDERALLLLIYEQHQKDRKIADTPNY